MAETVEAPVVVGVDGSPPGWDAIRLAAQEAVFMRRPLRVVHAFVWPPAQMPDYRHVRRDAEALVADAVSLAKAWAPRSPVSGEVVDGEPGTVLRREGRTAALVVLGRSDPEHRWPPVDSVVIQVAARIRCPVLVDHPLANPAQATAGPVLVGADGSPDSAAAIRFGLVEAAWRGTDLVIVRVDGGGQGGYESDPPVTVRQRRVEGEPAKALLEESGTGQLMVVGARGAGRLPRTLLGTVGQTLIRRAYCPVAIVRA
jgi:nucleotide-binding universal stress UspA family protein